MRTFHLLTALFFLIIIDSCKPKNKSEFQNILTKSKDSVVQAPEQKPEQKPDQRPNPHDLLIGKWRVTDVAPATESEKSEALNIIMEFTPAGNLFITDKDKTELAATITFSFDNNYLYSRGMHGVLDTLFIEQLNNQTLILSSTKDNKTLVAARSN